MHAHGPVEVSRERGGSFAQQDATRRGRTASEVGGDGDERLQAALDKLEQEGDAKQLEALVSNGLLQHRGSIDLLEDLDLTFLQQTQSQAAAAAASHADRIRRDSSSGDSGDSGAGGLFSGFGGVGVGVGVSSAVGSEAGIDEDASGGCFGNMALLGLAAQSSTESSLSASAAAAVSFASFPAPSGATHSVHGGSSSSSSDAGSLAGRLRVNSLGGMPLSGTGCSLGATTSGFDGSGGREGNHFVVRERVNSLGGNLLPDDGGDAQQSEEDEEAAAAKVRRDKLARARSGSGSELMAMLLMQRGDLSLDDLAFEATNGGIGFGGGDRHVHEGDSDGAVGGALGECGEDDRDDDELALVDHEEGDADDDNDEDYQASSGRGRFRRRKAVRRRRSSANKPKGVKGGAAGVGGRQGLPAAAAAASASSSFASGEGLEGEDEGSVSYLETQRLRGVKGTRSSARMSSKPVALAKAKNVITLRRSGGQGKGQGSVSAADKAASSFHDLTNGGKNSNGGKGGGCCSGGGGGGRGRSLSYPYEERQRQLEEAELEGPQDLLDRHNKYGGVDGWAEQARQRRMRCRTRARNGSRGSSKGSAKGVKGLSNTSSSNGGGSLSSNTSNGSGEGASSSSSSSSSSASSATHPETAAAEGDPREGGQQDEEEEEEDEERVVGVYSAEARRRRIERFLKKRNERVWIKKVKYDVRKNFADSRMRVKGRFVKKEDEDMLRELVSLT